MAESASPASFKAAAQGVMAVAKVSSEKPKKDEGGGSITVNVRVRPFIKEEITGERSGGVTQCCIKMPTKNQTVMVKPDGLEEDRVFEFDRCYWSHNENHPLYATQQTLQEELGETMIRQAMEGYNNCIFAYGQTGSGKSFSVLGGKGDARGLLPRVVEALFEHFKELPETTQAKTKVAFVEIYNEELKDLLAQEGEKPKLEVKQHPVLGTIIPGLSEPPVSNAPEVLELVEYGNSMRHVSATAMNASSSRSHCIFTFKTSVSESEGEAKMSQTHLVDLAGSERAGRTKASGDRLKEGAAINKSLSTLARVISELAKKGKKTNPPFRDSKLTYALKECLCGNSKTVMMAAISPSLVDYDETLSTMKFAQSVKLVQTKAVANAVNEKGVEDALRKEIEALKAQLQQQETIAYTAPQDSRAQHRVSEMHHRLEEQEELAKLFGKDWNTLLKEERERMQSRRVALRKSQSITSEEEKKSVQESLQRFNENRLKTLVEEDQEPDAEDGEDSDTDTSSATDDELTAKCPLAILDDDSEPRCTLRVEKTHTMIALTGPQVHLMVPAGAMQSAEERATSIGRTLHKCKQDAKRAEEAIAKRILAGVPKTLVKAQIVVDPEVSPPKADIIFKAKHEMPSRRSTVFGSLNTDMSSAVEWLSMSEFQRRLTWLVASEEPVTEANGDPWAASAAACGGRGIASNTGGGNVPRRSSVTFADQRPPLARQNTAQEVDTLHRDLCARAEMQDRELQKKARDIASMIEASFSKAIESVQETRNHLHVEDSTASLPVAKVRPMAAIESRPDSVEPPALSQASQAAKLRTVVDRPNAESDGDRTVGSAKEKPTAVLVNKEDVHKVHSAIRWGKAPEEVEEVVKSLGANMAEATSVHDPTNGNLALHIAAQNGHLNLVEMLLSCRADPNGQNNSGHTALHMSVEYDFYFVSKTLLNYKADPKRKNNEGNEALVGLSGSKAGLEAWDSPMFMLKSASDKVELEEAFAALESAEPHLLDKADLVKVGISKKKELKEVWDQARFQAIFNNVP